MALRQQKLETFLQLYIMYNDCKEKIFGSNLQVLLCGSEIKTLIYFTTNH